VIKGAILKDGHYAVRYGEYCRLIWLRTQKVGRKGAQKYGKRYRRILAYKRGDGWEDFAFLNDDGSLKMYHSCKRTWTPEQLAAIQSGIDAIRVAPGVAQQLYEEVTETAKVRAENLA
jgi:hypothetical protein